MNRHIPLLGGFVVHCIQEKRQMIELSLYSDYSRQEVHEIFAPDTPFTPQSGTWGLQGIIAIPGRTGDFVFFVTFGQQQGEHVFDEGITEDGVLSWQSQPKQSLKDSRIRQLISHDDLTNSIYLFLRAQQNAPYTFLGRLKYLSHDTERENPVWFQWQILDWQPTGDLLSRINLALQPSTSTHTAEAEPLAKAALIETMPPASSQRKGEFTHLFRARKIADRSAADARNKKLGLEGELLVLEYEQQSLRASFQPELADKVRHVAKIEGDGAGYDILSFTASSEEKYIEVKTSTSGRQSSFFMSSNEVAFAKQHSGNFYLYRVYDFDTEQRTGNLYIVKGDELFTFQFSPSQFRIDPG